MDSFSEGGESCNKDFHRLKHIVQGILYPLLELNSKQNQFVLMEESQMEKYKVNFFRLIHYWIIVVLGCPIN